MAEVVAESLSLSVLARMAEQPPEVQAELARKLGREGLEEAMRLYARELGAAQAAGINGLGKNIFEKIGDFLGRATREVGEAVGSVVAPVIGAVVPKAPQPAVVVQPPPTPAQEYPAWLPWAVIGGGALLLVLIVRRPA